MPGALYCKIKSADLRLHASWSKPHNRPVAPTSWQKRIRRAETLAVKHPFASEILGFYIHAARFQEGLYQRAERGSVGVPTNVPSAGSGRAQLAGRLLLGPQDAGAAGPLNVPEILRNFPAFLSLLEQSGPALLAQVARVLQSSPESVWSDLLDACWSTTGEPSSPEEFLALAFLQPYAEFARSRVRLQLEGLAQSLCPFCNRKPVLAILRPEGDGGRRSLLCGFCLTEWEFRRIICPGCGQEDHSKLPVYTAETFPYIRVECCDNCQTFVKSIDMTKNGVAEPLVDELASIPLNLWAEEHGYAKLRPNLLGM